MSDSLSHEQLLQQAEQSFAEGLTLKDNPDEARQRFQQAAETYRQLAQRGLQSAALYRNLGNAEYLSEQLPQAILAWRKGLELAPGDAEMRANLEYARKQVVWPPDRAIHPPAFVWPVGVPFPSANQLAVVLVFCFALMCVGFVRWLMVRRARWLAASVVSLVLFLFAAVGLAAILLIERHNQQYPIVVISAEKTAFRRGNGDSYPEVPQAPYLFRGMEARRLYERGNWLQIEFAGGVVGWVRRAAVVVE